MNKIESAHFVAIFFVSNYIDIVTMNISMQAICVPSPVVV